jgi:hypothetical protein
MVCFGVKVGLRSTTVEGLEALRRLLPRAMRTLKDGPVDSLYSYIPGGAGPRAGVKTYHVLYRNSTRLARTLDPAEVKRTFHRELSLSIGERAKRRVFIHSGVVGMGDGVILIPGKSFSGKTTLTRALVEAGGTYYSDEYAVLDPQGRVWPWAEPLSIRPAERKKPAASHSPESLGLRQGRKAVPVHLVVMTSYEAGRRFRPKATSRAAGVLGLLLHTLPARKRPKAALAALSKAASRANVIEGSRGDAREAARSIIRYLTEARRP